MQSKHVPSLSPRYWVTLTFASIFGANTGDFFSDQLELGHLKGLPILALLFAVVIVSEKLIKGRTFWCYWAAIIIVRTAATNLGDLIPHDLKIDLVSAMIGLTVLLLLIAWLWGRSLVSSRSDIVNTTGFPVNSVYWLAMLIAGTLGTMFGDYFSFRLKLGNLVASTILLGASFVFYWVFRNKLNKGQVNAIAFWCLIALIRSGGTAAGDLLTHHVFNLPVSTLVTGIVFCLVAYFLRDRTDCA